MESYERWDHTDILIHEATFIKGEMDHIAHPHRHSYLEEVLKMVSEIKIGTLILSHFSTRYKWDQIEKAIRRGCKEYTIQIPVYCLLPGETQFDILQRQPINA